MRRVLLLLALWGVVLPLSAHELQTAVLRLEELQPGLLQVTLKTPLARDGGAAAVVPQFPAGCAPVGEVRAERSAEWVLRQWRLQCEASLAGQRLRIEGLDPRMPEALVTLRLVDGHRLTAAVDRQDPVAVLAPQPQAGPPPGLLAYLPIGIEHILLGPDHLLFVLGLMLVVLVSDRGWRTLVAAVTAFTLAHSLTLALAVLGVGGLPSKPVELLIALSIVLLAAELARFRHSHASGTPAPSIVFRKPWLVAFVFGLLHGFGFAGALAEVGLPEAARGWALLLFNLGVELGQLLFVATVLLVWALLRRAGALRLPAQGMAITVTLLGGVAMYWTLDRLLLWSASLGVGV
ncbi:MAG TPA: HupE/UreJ family protein [Nevskiales bacterium]|nr:HupE/UreJ family protein [Nevskiales bacterium]